MSPPVSSKRILVFARVLRWVARAIGVGAAALLCTGGYFWFSTDLPAPERLRDRAALGSTRILDRRGQLLYALPDPLSGRQRPIALHDIPLSLRQATIAVEDAGFYQNSGVELSGILRAAWVDLQSGALVAGGSTITQQLARGFLLDPELAQRRTLDRKLREAVLALKLTAGYSKDDILALYLNQTYYGGMSYGVEAAARHYFGKPARDLDLAESALLAGLPQAPSRYDPFADRAIAQARQSDVLDAMTRAGYVTPVESERAKAEPLQFATERTEVTESRNSGASSSVRSVRSVAQNDRMRAPHFVQYVLGLLEAQLGPEVVARGGLTVTTTLDVDLQDAAQELLRRQVAQLATPRDGGPDHRVRNGAVVVLDPSSGAILTMVGSPNFDDAASQGQVNAVLARRQPGSAIKPLTYAAALERGWTPASTILDIPTTFQTREGRPYAPQNYDRAYHGPLALREALATSSNVAAVRVLDSIGIPALLDIAKRLGITTLGNAGSAGRYGLSLTLGGGEVTPLELTAAFGAFANGGRRVTPFAIIGLSGPGLRTEWPSQSLSPQSSVLSPEVAFLITDILSDRYARMHAFGAQSALDIDRPAAAKTGTTSDWRDNWTVGYTPDRVVGVWVGNADGQPMEAISGVSGAGPLWHDVMLAAHRGLPPRQFTRPEGIVETTICAEGGLLPTPSCPATRRERFLAGSEPHQPDDSHVAVKIDSQLGCRAPAGYPADRVTTRVFRILPPEAEAWVVAAGLVRVPKDVCTVAQNQEPRTENPASSTGAGSQFSVLGSPALLTPAPGSVFSLSPGVPRARQQIELNARAGTDVAKLTLLIDGQPLAVFDRPPYRAFWPLAPGVHRARVETIDAQGQVLRSTTVEFVVEGK